MHATVGNIPVKRALLSVAEKKGIVDLAVALADAGVEILSTGGTAKLLRTQAISCVEVSEYTDFPEILNGRVKTLHPKIYGGLLARQNHDDQTLRELKINRIDLVVVNLYPFTQITRNAHKLDDAIESIDIGGVTLIRAAAKNMAAVTVVTSPDDYATITHNALTYPGKLIEISYPLRWQFAQKAFAYIARYDAEISNYFGRLYVDGEQKQFPSHLSLQFQKVNDLRYGENQQQAAALYSEAIENNVRQNAGIVAAQQLQGKSLSFNNIADADAALSCASTFDKEAACVIVKHANPCGAAIADDVLTAYRKAYEADKISAFGSIIAFNRELDETTAQQILSNQFVEVIIAPAIAENAKEVFIQKPNVRLLIANKKQVLQEELDYRRIHGGLLVQQSDHVILTKDDLVTVSDRKPNETEIQNLLFAWRICKFVKSNAIVFARAGQTIGIGAGQMSRIDSVNLAALKAQAAGLNTKNAVVASDAFFPFRDSIDSIAKLGIHAIIQPGGSIRDDEIIAAANEAGLAMVFTNIRHFRH